MGDVQGKDNNFLIRMLAPRVRISDQSRDIRCPPFICRGCRSKQRLDEAALVSALLTTIISYTIIPEFQMHAW